MQCGPPTEKQGESFESVPMPTRQCSPPTERQGEQCESVVIPTMQCTSLAHVSHPILQVHEGDLTTSEIPHGDMMKHN